METPKSIPDCLPFDVALKIASSLTDEDVCRLGSCNRYWREICGADPVWISLSKKRWPSLFTHPSHILGSDPPMKEWKRFYAKMHKEVGDTLASVVTFVDQCTSVSNSIELSGYRKLHEQLASAKPDYIDVELFLFNPELSVILNLLGLHYSIKCLKMNPEIVAEALRKHELHERKVEIEWRRLFRRGCVLEGESVSGCFTLKDVVMARCCLEQGGVEELAAEREALTMLELDDELYALFTGGRILASSPS